MIILSIETSCDETAVSVVEVVGDFPDATYTIRGNALLSQIEIHREYGGVFPNLAKREHARTVVPMLEKALSDAGLEAKAVAALSSEETVALETLLAREPELADALFTFHREKGVPPIDLIAVTNGPGLEPALWVGVNFAKALARLWEIPVVPVNHMEGHVLASIFDGERLAPLTFPAIALLISGAHTELILMRDWRQYEKIGQTRDDAVGEAFDKVARLLGLPYPGGPEISRLAEEGRRPGYPIFQTLPRPMLGSNDYDFSFSGIKTAVRYAVEGKTLTHEEQCAVAREFEDAVTEVLIAKTRRALAEYGAQSAILGGGVSANHHIRHAFTAIQKLPDFADVAFFVPDQKLSTDNSIMIALAGHAKIADALTPSASLELRAVGNRSL